MVAIRDIVRLNEAGVGDFEIDPGTRASFQGITATWQGNTFVVGSITPEAQAAHPNVRVNQPLPRMLRGGMVNAARASMGLPRLDFDGAGNLRAGPSTSTQQPQQPSQRTPGNGDADLRADPNDRPPYVNNDDDIKAKARARNQQLRGPQARSYLRALLPGNFRPLTSALMITALQDMLIEVNNKSINGTITDAAAYNEAVNAAIGTWFAMNMLPVFNAIIMGTLRTGARITGISYITDIVSRLAGRGNSPLTPQSWKRRILTYIASESAGILVTQVAIRNETVRTYILELVANEYTNLVVQGLGATARSIDRYIVRNWPEDLVSAYDDVKDMLGSIEPEQSSRSAPGGTPGETPRRLPSANDLFGQ